MGLAGAGVVKEGVTGLTSTSILASTASIHL